MYMEKSMTPEAALVKMEILCSRSEHCTSDIIERLKNYDFNEKQINDIVQHLCDNHYIDDNRYCHCYANDKLRYNSWGRMKISQSLHLKGLDHEAIRNALMDIDEKEYLHILHKILKQKEKSISYQSDYERKGKLIRYASGKGFEINLITKALDAEDFF